MPGSAGKPYGGETVLWFRLALLTDLGEFLVAIWREWKTLLTGGSIIAIAWLVQTLRDKPNPQSINWLIVALTFIRAAFLAWRRERTQKLSEDKKSVRIEVLKLLAREYHCTLTDVYEKTGATFDLLVEMQAAGELYLSSGGWVMRERPKNR